MKNIGIMKNLDSCILKTLQVLVFPLMLVSCSFDGDSDCPIATNGDIATVRLQITANDPETVSTRFQPNSSEIVGSEVGKNGEYINSLLFFIVDGIGNVAYVKNLAASDLGGDASTGNLMAYTSEAITLSASASYTVYAFANMSDAYFNNWSKMYGLEEGNHFNEETLNQIILDDPASKIDLKNNFIPMSAKATLSLSSPVNEISLDRIVSKIRLGIKKNDNVNVQSFSISGWADRVPLVDNATLSSVIYDRKQTFQNPEFTENNGVYYLKDFYVNESPGQHPFTVSVTTDESGNPTYIGTTARDNIPRNCIYPLTLNLVQYQLELTAGFYFNPIGAHVPLNVDFEDGTYNVEIPDGMQFYFDAVMNGTTVQMGYTWTINSESQDEGIAFINGSSQSNSVTGSHAEGAFSATGHAGDIYSLTLNVAWGGNIRRTYGINITTIEFDEEYWLDQILNGSSNASSRNAGFLHPEVLNLFIK